MPALKADTYGRVYRVTFMGGFGYSLIANPCIGGKDWLTFDPGEPVMVRWPDGSSSGPIACRGVNVQERNWFNNVPEFGVVTSCRGVDVFVDLSKLEGVRRLAQELERALLEVEGH
jgi:hypothetical protein